jgi:hypothetical protein
VLLEATSTQHRWVRISLAFTLRGFYAIATKVEGVYELTLTAHLRQIISYIQLAVTLGLDEFTALFSCARAPPEHAPERSNDEVSRGSIAGVPGLLKKRD